jgi:hypothetical protein
MGVGDWVRDKITPQFVKDVNTALTPAGAKTAPPAETKTPQQAAYEAKTDAMNAQNPHYKPGDAVPRAKGGPVKAGGHPMKNVDNSGMTKMAMGKMCK